MTTNGYSNSKFVFGVVFESLGYPYYVPVSSIKESKHLKNDGTLKPNYKKTCLPIFGSHKNFDGTSEDKFIFCKTHITTISKKASSIYEKAKKPTHYLNEICCDFSLLEFEYANWIKNKKR